MPGMQRLFGSHLRVAPPTYHLRLSIHYVRLKHPVVNGNSSILLIISRIIAGAWSPNTARTAQLLSHHRCYFDPETVERLIFWKCCPIVPSENRHRHSVPQTLLSRSQSRRPLTGFLHWQDARTTSSCHRLRRPTGIAANNPQAEVKVWKTHVIGSFLHLPMCVSACRH